MKKTFLLVLLCCLISFGFSGNVVPVNDAKTVSKNFVKALYPDLNVTTADFVLQHTERDENGIPVYYQFAIGENGFILVSADDAVSPILAYSLTDNFDPTLRNYATNLYRGEILASRNEINPQAQTTWNHFLTYQPRREVIGQYISEEVKPFVTSKWNQGEYYNYLCPAQEDASQYQSPSLNCDNHVPVGCVAVAATQIMYYYRYPESGVGGISYVPTHYIRDNDNNIVDTLYYPRQTQSFAGNYNYEAMPDELDHYTGEVAKLLWHSGLSVMMDYGPDGSGAHSPDALTSFKDNWKYVRTGQYYLRAAYSAAKWMDTLKKELDARRPIYYAGSDNQGGHAFVLDGYQMLNDINRRTHYGDTLRVVDHIDTTTQTTYDIDTITIDSITTYDTIAIHVTEIYDTIWRITHTDSLTTYTLDTTFVNMMAHVNWGWGGDNNGYFAVNLAGHMGGYTNNEGAMIGVFPADQAPKATTGNVRVTASRGSISDGAGNINYEPNTDRSWMLAAPDANRYTIKFSRLETAANDEIIFYKNGNLNDEYRRCSGNTLPSQFSINADSVLVRFVSNADENTDKGFVFNFTATTPDMYCSNDYVTLTNSGMISDKGESTVGEDTPYRPNGICRWKIDGATTTYFSFPKIELGAGDYIDIYEYNTPNKYELIQRIDNYNWPEDVFVTHARRIRIHFVTDNYDEGNGFNMTYEIVTGVKENGISDLSIYPNPASSTLNVDLTTELEGQLTFRITDMTGRTIATESVANYGGEIHHSLNISNLSKGLYLLNIEGTQGNSVHKFIVE